jgi:hypothetical protein
MSLCCQKSKSKNSSKSKRHCLNKNPVKPAILSKYYTDLDFQVLRPNAKVKKVTLTGSGSKLCGNIEAAKFFSVAFFARHRHR